MPFDPAYLGLALPILLIVLWYFERKRQRQRCRADEALVQEIAAAEPSRQLETLLFKRAETWWRSRTDKAFELFQQAVRKHFSFLETLGYERPTFSREKSSVEHGWVYEGEYRRTDRAVTIDAVDSRGRIHGVDPRRQCAVSLFIWRQPRRGNDDDMDIDLFGEKYDPALSAPLEHAHQTACKTVESAIAAIFPMYAALLQGTAKPVVTGESWESGFYTDWTL